MAKHIPSLQLSCEDGSSSAGVPLSLVHLPAVGAGANSSALRTSTGQTIQMFQVGGQYYQMVQADSSDEGLSKKDHSRAGKSIALNVNSGSGRKVTYVKTEKDDYGSSFSNEDDDSPHLDEESTDQPEGSLINLALASSSPESSSAAGATIVQGPDGRFFIPVPVLSSNVTSLSRGLVVQASESESVGSPPPRGGEQMTVKRELRLLKNREAARECRRKKKEYVRCLENRVSLLENQNKTLISELKSLKELYCQKEPHS